MRVIELETPVVGQNLIGREEWVQLFIKNVVEHRKTIGAVQFALVAPRRTGKTSILLETFNRLFYRRPAGDELIPLFFNLEEILKDDPIDTFPERYLLQLYAGIINFRLGKEVYSYQNLEMPEALELSKTHGYHDYLTRTLHMMESDRSRGGCPAFRVVALLGDINVAEPDARAGFAGPNIIEQTIRQKLPKGFQRSEFLLEHGAIDMIVHRTEMRDTLARLLAKMGNIEPAPQVEPQEDAVEEEPELPEQDEPEAPAAEE